MTAINTYDEYGVPGASNAGTFQYTGQMWLSRPGLYNYRARAYAQHLGVFAQTDPIGQAGGPNIYAYVGADPVNGVDPFGLDCRPSVASGPASGQITITQCNYENAAIEDALAAQAGFTLGNSIIGGIQACRGYCAPIEIRARVKPKNGDSGRVDVCPTGVAGSIRNWAARAADITGKGSNFAALVGLVPTPLSPGLEAAAGGLRVLSIGASVVEVGADAVSGDWRLAAADTLGAAVTNLPLGKVFSKIDDFRPGGSNLSMRGSSNFKNAADNGWALIAAYTMPSGCQ